MRIERYCLIFVLSTVFCASTMHMSRSCNIGRGVIGIGIHDVAITSFYHMKAGCTPETVCRTMPMEVYVTVENQGNFQETFNVTLYANETRIGEKTVTLAPSGTATLALVWDTTDFEEYGRYDFSAIAAQVFGETELADNAYNTCTVWNKTYGGAFYDWADSLIQTSDGGYAVAGHRGLLSDFAPWLIKTDAYGNLQWSQSYEEIYRGEAMDLIQTADGGYVLAGGRAYFDNLTNTDFWLAKTDSSGNIQWNETYGGVNAESARSLIQTSDGGFALLGSTESYGAGSRDFWLVKTDAYGNLQWSKTYGGALDDFGRSLIQASDGGYVMGGHTYSLGAGCNDFWLVKTYANGNMQWNKTYGGVGHDYGYSMLQTADGGYALAGELDAVGSADFWLVKTDSFGNMLWNETYGGANGNADIAYSLVQTDDGGYAIAGRTFSFGAGYDDFWLVKVDASGNHQWNQTYGGPSYERANDLIQTSDGGFALAGLTRSFSVAYDDWWVVKTDVLGNLVGWVRVVHMGDVTGDGKVDITDVAQVSGAFGALRVNDLDDLQHGKYMHPIACPTCPHEPNADINGDSKIDIQDLARTSGNFGWHR